MRRGGQRARVNMVQNGGEGCPSVSGSCVRARARGGCEHVEDALVQRLPSCKAQGAKCEASPCAKAALVQCPSSFKGSPHAKAAIEQRPSSCNAHPRAKAALVQRPPLCNAHPCAKPRVQSVRPVLVQRLPSCKSSPRAKAALVQCPSSFKGRPCTKAALVQGPGCKA